MLPPSPVPSARRKRSISAASSSPLGDLLIARRLQLLEEHPDVVVGLDRRIESCPLLGCVLLEGADGELDGQMASEVLQERERRGREGSAHVVGDLGVEPDGRDAASVHGQLDRRQACAGNPEQPRRPFGLGVVERAVLRRGREHRDRSCVRYRGGDGAQAHPFDHAEPEAELQDVVAQLTPSEVRFRTVQDQEVAAPHVDAVHLQRWPREALERAVDDVQHGTT